MGEEKKEEEEKKGETEQKEEEDQEIVLKVDMHCEACARKVARSLRGFQGVDDVMADCKASKMVVKGKTADPLKVCERIQKKSGRKVEIISPLPQPPPPPEEVKADKSQQQDEQKKDEAPAVITVVLQVGMHCDACAYALQRRIRKIQGVESVTTDVANGQVTVKGIVDPTTLVKDVYKKTRKQALLVVNNEEDQEEKDKNQQEEDQKKNLGEEGKVAEEAEQLHLDDHQKMMMMMMNMMDNIKKNEHNLPSNSSMVEYHYANYNPPHQMFSDENPHACSLM